MDYHDCRHILATYLQATESEIIHGRSWYADAYNICERIGSRYDLPAENVAGVVAALSPNNRWERNIIDAENLIRTYKHSDDLRDVQDVKVCTYPANKAKAIAILNECDDEEIGTIMDILHGPKLIEFYRCIIQDAGDVCIDAHAYSVWLGQRLTVKQIPKIGVKLRAHIKQCYHHATMIINDHFLADGEHKHLLSHQVQAITWVTHKRIHNI